MGDAEVGTACISDGFSSAGGRDDGGDGGDAGPIVMASRAREQDA